MNHNEAIIIYYTLTGLTPREKTRFCRQFWGFKDKSTFGKYTYDRKGIMTDIPHIRIAPSLLIVHKENRHQIEQISKVFRLDLFVRTIILEKNDVEEMSR